MKSGSNPVTMRLEDFSPVGASTTENFGGIGEPLVNNVHTHNIVKTELGEGVFGSAIDYFQSIYSTTILETMTNRTSEDGLVVTGQEFAASSFIRNDG